MAHPLPAAAPTVIHQLQRVIIADGSLLDTAQNHRQLMLGAQECVRIVGLSGVSLKR